MLNPELTQRPDAIARFLREARAAAAVEHENVVPIWHVGTESGAPYIVMPLLKGEALDKHLKRGGALAPAEVVRIGREIAAGLDAAHARGLVHRDMKPANVWLDEGTGAPAVLDFRDWPDWATGPTRSRNRTRSRAHPRSWPRRYSTGTRLMPGPICSPSARSSTSAPPVEKTGRSLAPTITAILKAGGNTRPGMPPIVGEHGSCRSRTCPAYFVMKFLAKNLIGAVSGECRRRSGRQRRCSCSLIDAARAKPPRRGSSSRPLKARGRDGGGALLFAAGIGLAALLAVGVIGFATRAPARWRSHRSSRRCKRPCPPPVPGIAAKCVDACSWSECATASRGNVRWMSPEVRLPLTANDRFRIRGEVDPPAYLYLVWVDPDHDLTPAHPWNPEAERWQGTRPATEEPDGQGAPAARERLVARPKRNRGWRRWCCSLAANPVGRVGRSTLERWFKELPELPSPPGGEGSAVWFDDYAVVKTDPSRRAQFVREETNDPFERWQGQLQRSLSGKAQFQTAVSFARTGRK